MTPELSKKFFDRFDFIHTSGDPRKDAMVWGVECGDGWFDLLWELCESIENELNNLPEEIEFPFQVLQIKEKFGTLRFYTNWETEAIGKLIQEAEDKSAETCEVCGKPGKLQGDGWLYTACEEHR